ncbi:mavicyanin [Malania oleifera]|uniref:mavicyanin n=1 Tax=Malania oleifera TaxID=397392 RepID=UPI0025AEAAF3|nr:mavicyanin [Malania oleifera]
MAKLFLVCVLVILSFALTCNAAMYMVGGSSGWDISTDVDTWAKDKKFTVGDVLVFQYSSYHSVSEVKKENYEGCNTTAALLTSRDGNTSIPLTKPGTRYFVCGNKLHCLGGMKLQVNTAGASQTSSPASAPHGAAGLAPRAPQSLPRPSSKNNNPSATLPTSAGFICYGRDTIVLVFLAFMAVTLLWVT